MSTTPSKAVASSKVASPASTPEEQQKTLGGMPPVKSEEQINAVNSPKKAPGTR